MLTASAPITAATGGATIARLPTIRAASGWRTH
jgi:hypothetical protein